MREFLQQPANVITLFFVLSAMISMGLGLMIGDRFFAGAGYLNKALSSTEGIRRAVVVLRLRCQKEVGSTFLRIIARNSPELQANGGRPYLAVVSEKAYKQLKNTGVLETLGKDTVYSATDIVTESFNRAIEDAEG